MKKTHTLHLGLLMVLMAINSYVQAQTYTFTNATATGNLGPTQVLADAEYLGTTLAGNVTVIAGIQYWTVPTTGNYQIEAYGGQGYGSFGGRGAHMTGDFALNAGDVLTILVGQQAGDYLNFPATTYNHQFGGGGGSFITTSTNTPLVVAGGGGGNHGTSFVTSADGQITTTGNAGANASITGAGGTAGNGGLQASSADAGGGLIGDGDGTAGGVSFINGGLGGIDEGTGGFGCGGGTSSWNNYRGGGGGGYSGGGGANNSGSCCPAAGGGGSFNSGTNQNNLAGIQLGHGSVVITSLCSVTSALTLDATTLSDLTDACSVAAPTAPTATNNCVSINGTPDVTFPITTQGTTVITWSFNDGVNTIVTQTQNVIINDATAPTPDIATLSDSTYWCVVNSLAVPTATDNCEGAITGTTTTTLPITTSGLTVVTWTYADSSGNTVTQTQNITLNVIDNGISQLGDSLNADMSGYSYQWLNCDSANAIIPGDTNHTYTPTIAGSYAVEVTSNGCIDTSACLSFSFVGINEMGKQSFVMYPNPSNDGMFTISTKSPIIQLDVIDAVGRTIQLQIDPSTGLINGSSLVSGKYIVRVITEEKVYTKQLMVLK